MDPSGRRAAKDRSRSPNWFGARRRKKSDGGDKYKGSLSEGMKRRPDEEASDQEEEDDDDIEDKDLEENDEDEETIIAKRRAQREALLQVCAYVGVIEASLLLCDM